MTVCRQIVNMSDVWGEFQSIFTYMQMKQYPEGCSKNEKRRIREKAESFAVCEGVLMHQSSGDKLCRVIVDPSEEERILSSLHADPVGGAHFSQTATIKKITDRFWWRSVTNDVRDFVRACALCQRANPSNKALPSTLHSVKVKQLFHRWGIFIFMRYYSRHGISESIAGGAGCTGQVGR